MIKLRRYLAGDSFQVPACQDRFAPVDWMEKHIDLKARTDATAAFTFYDESGLLGCAGISMYWRGMAECWGFYAPVLWEKYPKFLYAKSLQIMDKYTENLELKRLQATIRADSYDLVCWIERLGFAREGKMNNYGPDGKDYYMYGRIR